MSSGQPGAHTESERKGQSEEKVEERRAAGETALVSRNFVFSEPARCAEWIEMQ